MVQKVGLGTTKLGGTTYLVSVVCGKWWSAWANMLERTYPLLSSCSRRVRSFAARKRVKPVTFDVTSVHPVISGRS